MFNNLFKPSVSRVEHDHAIRSYEETLRIAIQQRDTAGQERDEAIGECNRAIKRGEQSNQLLQRALILLSAVKIDVRYAKGKQIAEDIAALQKKAMEPAQE